MAHRDCLLATRGAGACGQRGKEWKGRKQQAGHVIGIGEKPGRQAEIDLRIEVEWRGFGVGARDLERAERDPADGSGDQRRDQERRAIGMKALDREIERKRGNEREDGRDRLVWRHRQRQCPGSKPEQRMSLSQLAARPD